MGFKGTFIRAYRPLKKRKALQADWNRGLGNLGLVQRPIALHGLGLSLSNLNVYGLGLQNQSLANQAQQPGWVECGGHYTEFGGKADARPAANQSEVESARSKDQRLVRALDAVAVRLGQLKRYLAHLGKKLVYGLR